MFRFRVFRIRSEGYLDSGLKAFRFWGVVLWRTLLLLSKRRFPGIILSGPTYLQPTIEVPRNYLNPKP